MKSGRRSQFRTIAAILVALGAAAPLACGDDPEPAPAPAPASTAAVAKSTTTTTTEPEPSAKAPPAHCAPGLSNCETASGTIIYIERVDPDEDGDAHFVLASDDSITLPGISVIDVGAGLRPHPLPPIGTHVSAAGPVYSGSYGQRQIEATELNVAD